MAGVDRSQGNYGIEVGGFYFEHHELHFQATADSSGNSVLAIPFVNVTSGNPQAASIVLAQPGVSSGTATLDNGRSFLVSTSTLP